MSFDAFSRISAFVLQSFLHIWPYLLVTIPLAVAVQMSGASKYIKRAFGAKPLVAIVLATVAGAFSPFCSCTVIPVIASLLISGVPLAPVMSFWIASPSMDPEIFFLSVGMIGWKLAVWRLAATLVLSIGAGLLTHFIVQKGWLGTSFLRSREVAPARSTRELLRKGWERITARAHGLCPVEYPNASIGSQGNSFALLAPLLTPTDFAGTSTAASVCRTCSNDPRPLTDRPISASAYQRMVPVDDFPIRSDDGPCCNKTPESFRRRLARETMSATWMVGKFMAMAFLLEGLITLYVPADWISGILGGRSPLAILAAALLGVPAYTTTLTALPLISGLLAKGMNPAAALAFLIAGPTTTLPAMAAVWPLVSRRVFVLYISFALAGAVLAGYLYSLSASFF